MATPEGEGKRAALVYNPVKVNGEGLRIAITREAAAAGWKPSLFFETSVEDPGQGITKAALAAGVDVVLVAGGDGTVRAVSEAMMHSEVPLAIIPSGTGNLLARNLGLPLVSSAPMLQAAFSGERTAIDIGVAEIDRADGSSGRHAFVVMAGMGLDAAMIANTRPALKKSVGWVAYVDGAARSLAQATPFRIMFQQPGHRVHSTKAQSVLVANCGQLPAGIALFPDASISDGELDIALIQPRTALDWVLVWRTVWWHNSVLRRTRTGRRVLDRHPMKSSVTYLRGEGLDLASTPAQPVELDGDEFGDAVRMNCIVEPGALLVAVPSGHRTPQKIGAKKRSGRRSR